MTQRAQSGATLQKKDGSAESEDGVENLQRRRAEPGGDDGRRGFGDGRRGFGGKGGMEKAKQTADGDYHIVAVVLGDCIGSYYSYYSFGGSNRDL